MTAPIPQDAEPVEMPIDLPTPPNNAGGLWLYDGIALVPVAPEPDPDPLDLEP